MEAVRWTFGSCVCLSFDNRRSRREMRLDELGDYEASCRVEVAAIQQLSFVFCFFSVHLTPGVYSD